MRFRVQLSDFAGPLDLLLYLVRKHELDPLDIPVAVVADQYLKMVETLEKIDVDAVADFLELATRLMEVKARMMLPREEGEEEETLEDPRDELVRRLLEYKDYKDAACLLEEQGRQWQRRFARQTNDLVGADPPEERPLGKVEVWDLVSAFGEVMRRHADSRRPDIKYDDTPIEVYQERLRERIAREPRLKFFDLFEGPPDRSRLVGLFLALLELIRHAEVTVEQEGLFGQIWISPGAALRRPVSETV